jgi:hypothetical protein
MLAQKLPVADLAGEALVCALSAVTGAAVASRAGVSMSAALAGPGLPGGLVVATLFLDGRWSPWPLPGASNWADVHVGWWAAAPVLAVTLVAANREV